MKALFDFISKLLAALSHAAGDSADKEEPAPSPDVPTVDTVTGWAGEPPYRYIDVSRYQGAIDWSQVAAAGYKGAMLKTVSTNRKLSKREDGLYIDPTFETNYRNAKAAGLDVGVYYYTYATNKDMVNAELAMLRQAIYGKELTLPVAVDVEDNRIVSLDKPDLTDLTAYALHEVEQMWFYAQLYTYTSFAKAHLFVGGAALHPYDVWLADYTGKTPKVDFKYKIGRASCRERV